MTTLDPSHLPWRSRDPSPSTGQAVHTTARVPEPVRRRDSVSSLDSLGSDVVGSEAKARVSGGQRRSRRVPMPPIPDLRYEQGFLLSILPFLRPIDGSGDTGKGKAPESEVEDVAGVKEASIFSRPLQVDWKSVSWVILRDQVGSPLAQGFIWGVLAVASTSFMIWRKTAPHNFRGASLLHLNLVAWTAALLGADASLY